MSALGGILNFGNTPATVDRDQLAQLGVALEARGPDGGRDLIIGNIGMTYRAYHTTPESRYEHQPYVSKDGHILSWNGRLDNRTDLIREVRSHMLGHATVTDLEIVMAAYLRWGEDFLIRLIGDFCLALWDSRLKQLYLAVDPVGARSLCFHCNDERIVWSTELKALLNLREMSLAINDDYVIGLLNHEPEPGLTCYKNIYAVKPAHVLTISPDGRFYESRFWGLNPLKEIHYQNDKDYEEHFLSEFGNAVKARLRSHLPVFAEESGGLDSSSIVCVADWLISRGQAETPRLETISQIYDESPSSDESSFINCVEEQRGRPGYHLTESEYPVLAPFEDESSIWIPNGLHAFASYYRGVCEIMRETGARVLLSGEGGDEMTGSSDDPSPELCDLLVQGRLFDLHNRLGVWSQALKRPYPWLLWQFTTVPVLPGRLQEFFKPKSLTVAPWLKLASVAQATLRDPQSTVADSYGFRLPSGRDQAKGFISISRHIAAGYRRERTDVETTYPFTHRPLVEFLQAIPFQQRVRPGETRSLVRRSLKHILPEKILRRRSKGSSHEVLCRALAREWPRYQKMFADSRVAARGYIDARLLLAALDRARYGCKTHFVSFIKVFSLEIWLRTLEREGLSASESDPPTRNVRSVPLSIGSGERQLAQQSL